jgi:probable phosphoglycerate mutase
MRRLVLWRHGRTEWNAQHRFQGQTDVPLDETGQAQAHRAAEVLARLEPTTIVASDLLRTRQTADALAQVTGLAVQHDPQLRETFAGRWQGLTRDEIKSVDGDEFAAWASGDDLRPGGGEKRSEVAQRMLAGVNAVLADSPADAVVVVVTHGGAARAAIGALLELPFDHWAALGVLTNCAWSVLLENDYPLQQPKPRWRLQEYNAGSLPEPLPADGVWPADDR